jgi:hypothetical protein
MPYEYKMLTEEEKDDTKVSFLLGQERDKFSHELNLERFNLMLKTLPPGPFRDRIQQLKTDTESRLVEVNGIIAASEAQMPALESIAAAKVRLAAKETAIQLKG